MTSSTTQQQVETKKLVEKIENDKIKLSDKSNEDVLHILKEKILTAAGAKENEVQKEELYSSILKFSEVRYIKKYYMNKNFVSTMKYFDLERKDKIGKNEKSHFRSHSEVKGFQSIIDHEEKEDENHHIISKEMYDELSEKVNEKIKIKIIITDQLKTRNSKNIRALTSPIASMLGLSPTYGLIFFFFFNFQKVCFIHPYLLVLGY